MAEFPENEIDILVDDDYVSEAFMKVVKENFSKDFLAQTDSFESIFPPNKRAQLRRISGARKTLLRFFGNPPPDAVLKRRDLLRATMEEMARGDFRLAQEKLNELNELPAIGFAFEDAFNPSPVDFIFIEEVDNPIPGKPPIKTEEPGTIPAYTGPFPSDAPGQRLIDFKNFLTKGPEHSFRIDLLQAEINVGLRKFEEAISLYGKLVPAAPPGSSRHKFVTLRSAFAHLALGDSLFRRFRNPDEDTRHRCREQYVAALTLVQTSGISPGNPLRQQIEQYATVQISKVDAGLNFIGYRDNYVPIIKPQVLQDLAERRIARAEKAIEKFELFKSKADQIQDQLKGLEFDVDIKAIDNEIAAERVANATDQKRIADERIEQIQSQLDALDIGVAVDLTSSLLQGVAAGFLAGVPEGIGIKTGTNLVGVAGAAGGFASTIAEYLARKDDLELQKKITEIESGIAARDVEIAELEQQMVGSTLEFLGEKIRRIQNRELNPDLYYAAAGAFRALAERHLDAAIYLAYLFERAVAFLRLKPELQRIRFDYLPLTAEQGNTLTAADRLAADLEDVVDENRPLTKFQLLTETYSLRLFYPIEFSRFLQTGDMDFTLSLYELNKRRPGVWRQRIKHIDVEVRGLVPVTGYTGRIIHRGSFLLRDKDTTPEPGAGRFIPTEQQLAEAFEALKDGATQGVPIAGVMPFLLDEDRLELSPDQPPPNLDDPAPEALLPIEGYGPAGDWRLEIENIDLRLITDVLLRVTYVIPESNGDLSRRVEGLIAAYEQELSPEDRLDLITPLSLRQQVPDTFSQLVGGQASLALRREDFPSGITDLQLKAVVAQALDRQKKGVEGLALGIARPGTALDLVRSTRADGFSEDVTVSIPFLPRAERFPVEGNYTLRLPDPGQASRLDDLILFVIYEFQEV